jgi:ribosome-binding protein aMBF1 (putative translation factor)
MGETAAERADQALTRYVKGGRTVADIGIEVAYLRRERGLSHHDLAQRARLPLEVIQVIESGTRLPTKPEFAQLAHGLELTVARLAELLRPVVQHPGQRHPGARLTLREPTTHWVNAHSRMLRP